MNLATQFREKAKQQIEASSKLLESADLAGEPKILVAAIVGQVSGILHNTLADMLDYQELTPEQQARQAFLKSVLERNEKIRKAAAESNWDEYDRLVSEREQPPGNPGASPSG